MGRDEISENQFWQDFDAERSIEERQVASKIIAWARGQDLKDSFRSGKRGSVFFPRLSVGKECSPIALKQQGFLLIRLRGLQTVAPFDSEHKRSELLHRIEAIPGVIETELADIGYPKFSLLRLADKSVWEQLAGTLDWIVAEIRGIKRRVIS